MNLVYKVIVGSQVYGTATPESDTDKKGVFTQAPRDFVIGNYIDEIKHNKDNVDYNLRKFLELLTSANPTMLEMLHTDSQFVEVCSEKFKNVVLSKKHLFVTKQCLYSFGEYAKQQIKKAQGLNKKINWKDMKRKTPIDFCYVVLDPKTSFEDTPKQGMYPLKDWLRKKGISSRKAVLNKLNHTREGYQLYIGEKEGRGIVAQDSTRLRTKSTPPDVLPVATVLYNPDGYTQYCKDYKSYQTWLIERNPQRVLDNQWVEGEYDVKNMLHCQRLINTARDIATEGTIIVARPERDYLLSIKRGEIPLQKLLADAEESLAELPALYKKSGLPKVADKNLAKQLLEEYYYGTN